MKKNIMILSAASFALILMAPQNSYAFAKKKPKTPGGVVISTSNPAAVDGATMVCNSPASCESAVGASRELGVTGTKDGGRSNANAVCGALGYASLAAYGTEVETIDCGHNYGLSGWDGYGFPETEEPLCSSGKVTVISQVQCNPIVPVPAPSPTPLQPGQIQVISALYGTRDATWNVAGDCNGAYNTCNYTVEDRILGDGLVGLSKRFTAIFICGGSDQQLYVQYGDNGNPNWTYQNTAGRETIQLNCANAHPFPGPSVNIKAVYGTKDVTSTVALECQDAVGYCNYTVVDRVLGDPLPGYSKEFQVTYTCGTNPTPFVIQYGENGNPHWTYQNTAGGETFQLSCQ